MDLREDVGRQYRRQDTSSTHTESSPPASFTPAGALRAAEERLAGLARVIEAEIIPRLMLAHGNGADTISVPEVAPGVDAVMEFTQLILDRDVLVAAEYVDAKRSLGMPMASIFLHLLTPAARRLGALWEADRCSFTEVTLALWRLQQLLHELSPAFQKGGRGCQGGRRALLVPAPGEQHTFGLSMVIEFFERAGWDVAAEHPDSAEQIVRAAKEENFDLLGLSAGTTLKLDVLGPVIAEVRRVSRNRAIGVMVGGPIFVEHPEYVALVGADVTAADGREAVLQAEKIVAFRQMHN